MRRTHCHKWEAPVQHVHTLLAACHPCSLYCVANVNPPAHLDGCWYACDQAWCCQDDLHNTLSQDLLLCWCGVWLLLGARGGVSWSVFIQQRQDDSKQALKG